MKSRSDILQKLCRKYLLALRPIAERHGLGDWVDNIISLNKKKECESTESEVEILARAVNEERIARHDIPSLFGMSYRQCYEKDCFNKIKNLGHAGTYSKVSATVESEVYNG